MSGNIEDTVHRDLVNKKKKKMQLVDNIFCYGA